MFYNVCHKISTYDFMYGAREAGSLYIQVKGWDLKGNLGFPYPLCFIMYVIKCQPMILCMEPASRAPYTYKLKDGILRETLVSLNLKHFINKLLQCIIRYPGV